MTSRVVAFMTVGVAGFAVQMIVLAALTAGLHWPAVAATALATEAAVLTNFFWHERWTWRDRRTSPIGRLERFGMFHLTAGATSVIGNVLVVVVLVRTFGANPLVANAAAVIALGLVNYLTADRWVFARQAAITTNACGCSAERGAPGHARR